MRKWAIPLGLCLSTGCPAKTLVVSLTEPRPASGISAEREHRISPYIYGFGSYLHEDRSQEKVWELKPSTYRYGGNTSSRFNYQANSWNSAADWFFRNNSGSKASIIDLFMNENRANSSASMITLPMMGWIAKDGISFSYPRTRFAKQDRFDGEAGDGRLNGKDLQADPRATSLPTTPAFVAGWVKKLKGQFGDQPHFYIMDNEPMLWNSTHRDVHPDPMTYDAYLKLYVEYAAAVRAADPEAVIIGPALWGWLAMQQSAFDTEGPWSDGKRNTDRARHHDQPFLEWFLEQLAKEEKRRKTSLLDIIDVHYYPEKASWPKGAEASSEVRRQLLKSTRSLWDRTYKDESWIAERLYFIPRLKEMAAKFKKSAKVSIGEYNFRGEKDAAGAIAQADVLGIMGREDLYAAQYWDFPLKDGTHRNAFLLYRNFDGKGSAFGDRYLPNSAGISEDYSVYTAEDGDDREKGKAKRQRVTVVLLNKDLNDEREFVLRFDGRGKPKSARIVGWTATRDPAAMQRYEAQLETGASIPVKTKPLSMQIVELNY